MIEKEISFISITVTMFEYFYYSIGLASLRNLYASANISTKSDVPIKK